MTDSVHQAAPILEQGSQWGRREGGDAAPLAEGSAWVLVDPSGRDRATERTQIKAWARLAGYKPTVENLLAYEELGWRVILRSTEDARDAARYRRLRNNWIDCDELGLHGRTGVIDAAVDHALGTRAICGACNKAAFTCGRGKDCDLRQLTGWMLAPRESASSK